MLNKLRCKIGLHKWIFYDRVIQATVMSLAHYPYLTQRIRECTICHKKQTPNCQQIKGEWRDTK